MKTGKLAINGGPFGVLGEIGFETQGEFEVHLYGGEPGLVLARGGTASDAASAHFAVPADPEHALMLSVHNEEVWVFNPNPTETSTIYVYYLVILK